MLVCAREWRTKVKDERKLCFAFTSKQRTTDPAAGILEQPEMHIQGCKDPMLLKVDVEQSNGSRNSCFRWPQRKPDSFGSKSRITHSLWAPMVSE